MVIFNKNSELAQCVFIRKKDGKSIDKHVFKLL